LRSTINMPLLRSEETLEQAESCQENKNLPICITEKGPPRIVM
jgi:hypothetical protein